MAIGELGELIQYGMDALAGWRYLLSPAYRRKAHARWAGQSPWQTAGEVFWTATAFVLVTGVLACLLYALLHPHRGGGWHI